MPKKPSITIRDLAAASGYSKSAVSAALRNSPEISQATRTKIQRVAQKMGYQTDGKISELMGYLSARKRKPEASPIVWLHTEKDLDSWKKLPWYTDTYAGAVERSQLLGYHLESYRASEKGHTPKRIRQILRTRNVSGIVLAHPLRDLALEELNPDFCACAQINCNPWDQRHHVASPDYSYNIQLTLQKIQDLGYQRPALMTTRDMDVNTNYAYTARYLHFFKTLPVRKRIPIFEYPGGPDFPNEHFLKWIQQYEPDCLICNDSRALPLLKKIKKTPPRQMGLVHLNHAGDVDEWSGIQQHQKEIGAAAIDLIVGQIRRNETGSPRYPRTLFIKGSWHEGKTTRAL